MCGIAGFWGSFGQEALAAMTAAVAHRGPDDEGLELVDTPQLGGAVGLGHRRLSIIDLSTGHQPMWNADRSCAIVFNGEIYNYRHLRNDLESRGARFLTVSDTEVILEGWRIEGEAILPKLEGMFAFAIWDSRTAEWIMARDRWGIKPLYLSQPTPGTIAFASEIKPLLGLTANRALNLRVLYEYLLYSWCPGPQTIFEGIRHLEPGHLVRWKPNDGDIRPRRYCGIDGQLGSVRPTDLADAVRSEFDRSVADHMIADVPVGLTLSGGLDSSCVLASMARLRRSFGYRCVHHRFRPRRRRDAVRRDDGQACRERGITSGRFARTGYRPISRALSGCSKSRSPTPSCRRRSRPRDLPGKKSRWCSSGKGRTSFSWAIRNTVR